MVTFYSAWYCPFAQRAWIGLSYKKVTFAYVETDPYAKTADWMRRSRGTGQVPVLQLQDARSDQQVVIPDSLRVLEFIDEAFQGQGPDFYPQSAVARADAKYWTDFPGRKIIPYMYRFLKASRGSDEAVIAARAMEAGLIEFSDAMSKDGPLFSGAEINAVDIAFAPFAARIDIILSHYHAYSVPQSGGTWARYARWWTAVQQSGLLEPTVGERGRYVDRLVEFYLPYSKGGGQADVTAVA